MMERNRHNAPQGSGSERRTGSGTGSWDAAVASRRAALEAIAATLLDAPGAGPILLTGEAGAGKTWLRRRLVEGLPTAWRAAVVAAAPAHDAVDFLTLTAARLGVAALPDRPSALRLAVAQALEDDANEGLTWLLIVEDAHHAAPAVWAEVEALCDGLRTPGGFAAVVLAGRTELARRLAWRPLRAVASRVSKHVHLPPLDVDEAGRLLAAADATEVERLHRDAAGNPRRLLGLAGGRTPQRLDAPPTPARPAASVAEAPAPPVAPPAPAVRNDWAPRVEAKAPAEARPAPPALLPSRPPLRMEEGLIEVGWEGSLDAEEAAEFESADEATPVDGELIEDHYAALQAWSEWARNRDRLNRGADAEDDETDAEADEDEVDEVVSPVGVQALGDGDEDEDSEVDSETAEEPETGGALRAEPRHEHAPYSQLFTRLRQSSS
ncbi:AAA family ATPase [Paludisphaera mucosa]|uniref:AAA family ATPase n=1 Tax=Paludisphaera mucosa TaxID=3030827 RepID=A0ABT6F3R2_9BACT|nr:AAA family ATPase [Paludisphaera mucosa]MDG3002184.1 AAA family ATPase [Paludisphaera mucosa]